MAPTLRPTREEFEDPLAYIREVRNQGYHKYGIVKIVPPEGWRPPFAINKETFKFSTRVQSINELQRRHIIAAKSQAFSRKVRGPCSLSSSVPGLFTSPAGILTPPLSCVRATVPSLPRSCT